MALRDKEASMLRSMNLEQLRQLAWTAFGLYSSEVEHMDRDELARHLVRLAGEY